MTITIANGAAVRSYSATGGAIYVNFTINWGLNGLPGVSIIGSPAPIYRAIVDVAGTIDSRSFGVARGIMVDNTRCRSPLLLIDYSTGWTTPIRPLETCFVNVDSNTTLFQVIAPGGTMNSDITGITISNREITPVTFGRTGIPAQHGLTKTLWFSNSLSLAATGTVALFSGDGICGHIDIDISGLIVGAGGLTATVALLAHTGGGTIMSIPLTLAASTAAFQALKIFAMRPPQLLYCSGGLDLSLTISSAPTSGSLAAYGSFE